MRLKNQRILITGGTAGIGAAVARKFVSEGAYLAINYANSRERADSLQKELEASNPGSRIILVQGDVSKSSVCTDLVDRTVQEFGGIDCIVSNAGWTRAANWEDLDALSEDEWDRMYATNVKAHLFLFKAVKPHFNKNAEGGSFIITGSIAGLQPSGSALAYSVSKHGAQALAKGLALHQGPKCRVNTIAPGLIETEWAEKQFGRKTIDAIAGVTPLKTNATAEDCADAFLLLATNKSMTGTTIVVDSGYSLRT